MKATFEAKLKDERLSPVLEAIADLFGRVERCLFRDHYVRGQSLPSLKRDYLRRFGLTARWFNAIAMDLREKVEAARRNAQRRVTTLTRQGQAVRQTLIQLTRRLRDPHEPPRDPQACLPNRQGLRVVLHQKKRRLSLLEARLQQAEQATLRRVPQLCFGSRHLFRAQFHLDENGYRSPEEWLKDWRATCSNQFLCLGSKEETGGNQTCTLFSNGTLRLRVPEALVPRFGRWVLLRDIASPYGQEVIEQALLTGQALTYRFVRRTRKGKAVWYLQVTADRPPAPILTSRKHGALGVDLNPHSVIGFVKFGRGYGLSPDAAAAVAIARRGLGFGERLSSRGHPGDREGSAFPLPVRTRGKHVWSDWGRLNRRLRRRGGLSALLPGRRPSEGDRGRVRTRSPGAPALLHGPPRDGEAPGPGWDSPAPRVGSAVRPACMG